MDETLFRIQTPYIDAQTLLGFMSEYQNPRDRIRRLVQKRELIRLKNGFYLIAAKIKQGSHTIIPYEQVANWLYGPSYVSLEWALSFYGMIPERVNAITSMSLGRDKEYRTPVANFLYYRLNASCYSIGIEQKKAVDVVGGFLLASPEKALADLAFKRCKGFSKTQLKAELLESRRMDDEHFQKLNKNLLNNIAEAYHSKAVDHLVNLIGIL